MTIETDRLILRPWNEHDAESLFEYAKDPEVGPIAGWPVHTSVENSLEVINNVLSEPEVYAVCLKSDSIAIGSIGLMIGKKSNLSLPDNEGEIGYWIGKPFWGQGLIPEAVRALIRHAFADMALDTLWCGYFDGNIKSKRCQEKCGFQYHHTNSDIFWAIMNDIRTEHITRLTKTQWLSTFETRMLSQTEIPAAHRLAWNVFREYEAPDYSERGINEFRSCLCDEQYLTGITYYGVFVDKAMVGMLGIREASCHICFLFIDGNFHRLGIGTELVRRALKECPGKTITVNSSPYGLPFYKSVGFIPSDAEQTLNGIRFTPMIYRQYN